MIQNIKRQAMEREKIYYATVILISAASVLLSPFFYVRRSRKTARTANPQSWLKIVAGNVVTALVLLAVWWFWLRNGF